LSFFSFLTIEELPMPNLDPLLQFYQIFMEQSDDGIWMVDLDIPLDLTGNDEEKFRHFSLHGLIRRCNAAFALMYGYDSPDELVGKSILEPVSGDDPQNIFVVKTFLRPPYQIEGAETHEVDKDGNPRWFLNDAWGIVENGKLNRPWGRQRETTVRKKRESERAELSRTLSPRLKATLHLISEGHTAKEIASVFKVAEKTVHNHRERLMKELKIGDLTSLIHYAHNIGISLRTRESEDTSQIR
jgi:PAS domain S-box-containing protein